MSSVRPCTPGHDLVLIACVLALLTAPLWRIDWTGTTSSKEKRALAEWPDRAAWRRLDPQLGREMENWLNDRFGGRDALLDWQARLAYGINGRILNEDTLGGRDGWLFYNKEGSVRSFQNADLFSPAELQTIRDNLTGRAEWLRKRGAHLYLLVVPAKNRVYGEFYPSGIRKVGSIGRAEQTVEYLRETTTVPVEFALEDLLAAKTNGEALLYFRQDTHWTDYGAFLGYRNLMRRIHRDLPAAIPAEKSDFQWEYRPEGGGDLTPLARVALGKSATDARYETLVRPQPLPFAYLLQHPFVNHTVRNGRPLKAFVLYDSFGVSMIPFLASTFGEVKYLRRHDFNEIQDEIAAFQPDLVIHVVAERLVPDLLNDAPPLRETDPDAL